MGVVADAYDNSMAESLVSTLKRELIHRYSWLNRQMARPRSSSTLRLLQPKEGTLPLGHLGPAEYEEARMRGGAVA